MQKRNLAPDVDFLVHSHTAGCRYHYRLFHNGRSAFLPNPDIPEIRSLLRMAKMTKLPISGRSGEQLAVLKADTRSLRRRRHGHALMQKGIYIMPKPERPFRQ